MDLHEMLTKSLTAHDNSRDRSKQVAIGPSAIGGCSRRVWHDLKQTPKTNLDTESLAAILGTFIHSGIAQSITREDPFGDNFLIEQPMASPNIYGHIDLFIKDQGLVVDWKTTKTKSLRYFPSEQQRYQVQVYGWLLEYNGYKVNNVSLVAIPRDGEMKDIRVHIEPYDKDMAETGLAWLEKIKEIAATDAPPPPPEEKVFFCSRYCSYYDATGQIGCPSIQK
jgi:CRISPR/Cas system-associated exonuclease Cas4 (RecB family)